MLVLAVEAELLEGHAVDQERSSVGTFVFTAKLGDLLLDLWQAIDDVLASLVFFKQRERRTEQTTRIFVSCLQSDTLTPQLIPTGDLKTKPLTKSRMLFFNLN